MPRGEADISRLDGASVFYTICANNYIAYAETLVQSLKSQHRDAHIFIVLCDKPADFSVPPSGSAEYLYAEELGIPEFDKMALRYDVMELATAIKPFVLLHLLDRFESSFVTYLDPDIYVLAPLALVEAALRDGADVVLTPHLEKALQDGKQPDDLTIMKSGIYNLGFIAVSQSASARYFVEWWRDRCRCGAIVDIANHMFTDQRWVDMAPAFVERCFILRSPGYNVAYWNLPHREITCRDGVYHANGEPVSFVHFSGIVPRDRSVFSKHQNRFRAADIGDLQPLFNAYIDRLFANGWEDSRAIPYGYERLGTRKITSAMRKAFRAFEDDIDPDDLVETEGRFFDEATPVLAVLGPPSISRVMHELWKSRTDLRRTFDVETASGREGYLAWFVESALADGQCDVASVQAAKDMLAPSRQSVGLLPWTQASFEANPRHRAEIDAWLAEPVVPIYPDAFHGPPIPRHFALLWSQRPDLQSHFSCRDKESCERFFVWCLTNGVIEGATDLQMVAGRISAYVDHVLDRKGGGAPVTRLSDWFWRRYDGPHPEMMSDYPHTSRSRSVVAIWLLGAARKRFALPRRMLQAFAAWAIAPAGAQHGDLSNIMYAVWDIRQDVKEGMNIFTADGRQDFLDWFDAYGCQEYELPSDLHAQAADEAVDAEEVRDPLVGRPAGILLTGLVSSASGRGEDVRMTKSALDAVGMDNSYLDRSNTRVIRAPGGGPLINIVHLNADTSLSDYLYLRRNGVASSYTIGYWAWELSTFPAEWLPSFSFYDEIWASTTFAYESFAASATVPVHLMPMVVRPTPPDLSLDRGSFGIAEDKFVFFFSFDLRSYAARKNPGAVLEAFRIAFAEEPGVALVLKTLGADKHPLELAKLVERIKDDRRIVILDAEYDSPSYSALINLTDCFVSLHRSEGFGRGVAEAMFMGKPVIATGYSGNMDFMNATNALPVDFTMLPVRPHEYPGWQGQHWADPSVVHAADLMRRVYVDRDYRDAICAKAQQDIRSGNSPERVGGLMAERLSEIRKDLARPADAALSSASSPPMAHAVTAGGDAASG